MLIEIYDALPNIAAGAFLVQFAVSQSRLIRLRVWVVCGLALTILLAFTEPDLELEIRDDHGNVARSFIA